MARRGTERFIQEVTGRQDLPELFRGALDPCFPEQPPWLALLIPVQEYPVRRTLWRIDLPFTWRRTPQRLMAFGAGQIVVLEDLGGQELAIHTIPLAALARMDIVTELLYSYVDLLWSAAGALQHLRVEFNSVSLHLMERGLSWARATIAAQALPALASLDPAIRLAQLPFKFRNYVGLSLLPGETLRLVMFQPAVRKPGTRWRAYLSPARAFALTDWHLIVVEDTRPRRRAAASYLITRQYLLRQHVLNPRLVHEQGEPIAWCALQVGRPGQGLELRWPLEPDSGAELVAALQEWLMPAALQEFPGVAG